MKEAFQNWLNQRGRLPGVLGCAVRFPDRVCLSQDNTRSLPAEKLDEAWNQVAEAATGLNQHRLAATHLLWTFAEGQLHCAIRSDGIVLGLITPVSTDTYDPALIDKVVEEFLQLESTKS